MDARSEYEDAVAVACMGRDLTGKATFRWTSSICSGYSVGCVSGSRIETIYHFILFGEYQDRAGFLWGHFRRFTAWRGDPDRAVESPVAVHRLC